MVNTLIKSFKQGTMRINAYKVIKLLLLLISIFIGVTAFWGGINLILDPSGTTININQYLPLVTFISSYRPLGVLLILLNGVPQLLVVFLLLVNDNISAYIVIMASVILLIWVGVKLVFIGLFFYSILYLALAVVEFILGLIFANVLKKELSKRNLLKDIIR